MTFQIQRLKSAKTNQKAVLKIFALIIVVTVMFAVSFILKLWTNDGPFAPCKPVIQLAAQFPDIPEAKSIRMIPPIKALSCHRYTKLFPIPHTTIGVRIYGITNQGRQDEIHKAVLKAMPVQARDGMGIETVFFEKEIWNCEMETPLVESCHSGEPKIVRSFQD